MSQDDDKSFLELVERQRHLIWSVCSNYNLSAAWTVDDCFQEVLVVLWRDFRKFRGQSTESHWVWRVATTTLLMLKRKTSNQPQPNVPPVDTGNTDDADFYYLRQLIDTLHGKEAVIFRAWLDGYSHKEIGVMVGLPAMAVAKRVSRTKEKLRRYYEK